MFQVVAVDEDQRSVEIQDFDGDVDEIDLDSWFTMPLDPAAAPEDWTGPVDDVEAADLGYSSDSEAPARDWRGPLDELPAQPQEAIETDEAEEAEDDDDRRGQ
jgi:hypothetical protein